MLKRVYIKNYALVEEGEICFQPGLNIITGETGAGKSILIGAIGTFLGERTSATVLRPGEAKAVIEGQFDLSNLPWIQGFLKERELDSPDGDLIIRREILASGRSRAFINDTPVTLDDVEQVAAMLVDLHGQHEHQSLLRVAEHLNVLDAYADLLDQREEVSQQYRQVETLIQELEALRAKERELREREDYLRFQLDEIHKIDPQPGEEEELEAEEKRLSHSAELLETSSRIVDLLYEREGSVIDALGQALAMLQQLSRVDTFFEPLQGELDAAIITVDELVKSIQGYASRVEINPERLEEVRQRLAAFTRLKKKYGTTIEGLLEKKEEIARELARIDSLEDEIRAKEAELAGCIKTYREKALKLSEKRKEAAVRLEREVPEILAHIGMSGATFQIRQEQEVHSESWLTIGDRRVKASPHGIDRVEFLISANPGQPPRPLQKVASGGEISRIMLALKHTIAHHVRIPVLIFDEIDIGISGKVAEAVGRKLQELANNHQIICITHLPQIASAGDAHFLVEKTQVDGTTTTRVRRLQEHEREWAIAQLLGGEKITESHLASARELLRSAGRSISRTPINDD